MSVIAQTNDDESVANFYAYSPFGETIVLGPDGGNTLRYTGREDDGTGLYYYRARYYDPVLKRFIAEDPIGISGGANLYAYVNGNPITNIDPLGQQMVPSKTLGDRIRDAIIRGLGPRDPHAGEAGAGAAHGIESGATGTTAGTAIGKAMCTTGAPPQGAWSECTEQCLKKMNAGSGGSEFLMDCTNSCTDAYNKCKNKPPQSFCPVPGLA